MATAPRPAVPSPQIFNSDPIEQTYAKGTLDPQMGGIAYAYLNAARGDRQNDQDVYMQSLKSAQNLQAQLQREDNQQELLRDALKMAPTYAERGISADEVPIINSLYKGGSGSSNSAALYRDLIVADAQAKRAAAAHAGDAGADRETLARTVEPNGQVGTTTITTQSKRGTGMNSLNRLTENEAQFRGIDRNGKPIAGPPTAGGTGVRPSIGTATQKALEAAQGNHPNSPIAAPGSVVVR